MKYIKNTPMDGKAIRNRVVQDIKGIIWAEKIKKIE